jgi:competence protein ComEC
MVWMVRLFGGLPAASVGVEGVGVGHAIAYYAALAATIVYLHNRQPALQEPPGSSPPLIRVAPALGAMFLLAVVSTLVVWSALSDSSRGRMTVTFLDVGQGESVLIRSPSGSHLLIDGGPSGELMTGALGRNLPFYDDRIDLVVVTHPQADHVGGLPAVLERYDVGAVLQAPMESATGPGEAWEEALRRSGTEVIPAGPGLLVDLGSGASLRVLSHRRDDNLPGGNDSSIVARLSYGEVSMLLTGDIEAAGELQLTRGGVDLRADVLKAAHHGSATSSSAAFLRRVQPRMTVISAGEANRFAHPSSSVLERLDGMPVYRTDEDGDIVVSTDGHSIWVDTRK